MERYRPELRKQQQRLERRERRERLRRCYSSPVEDADSPPSSARLRAEYCAEFPRYPTLALNMMCR